MPGVIPPKPPKPPESTVSFVRYADGLNGTRIRSKPVRLTVSQLAELVSGNDGKFWTGCGQDDVGKLQQYFKKSKYAFVRKVDVPKFLNFAAKEIVYISVRNTGPDTIKRLTEPNAGYACKPHDIMDKTLKPKSVQAALAALKRAKRLVGRSKPLTAVRLEFAESNSDPLADPNKHWYKATYGDKVTFKEDDSDERKPCYVTQTGSGGGTNGNGDVSNVIKHAMETCLDLRPSGALGPLVTGLVGWWVSMTLWGTNGDVNGRPTAEKIFALKIPIGVLKVGSKTVGEDAAKKHGMGVLFADIWPDGKVPTDAYTGDYDLHCMYQSGSSVTGGMRRNTVVSVEDKANLQGLAALHDKLVRRKGSYLYRTRLGGDGKEVVDRYAWLIQHGHQGDFYFELERECAHNMEQVVREVRHIGKSNFDFDTAGVIAFTPRPETRPSGQSVYLLEKKADFFHYYQENKMTEDVFNLGTLQSMLACSDLVDALRDRYHAEVTKHGNRSVLSTYDWLGAQPGIFMAKALSREESNLPLLTRDRANTSALKALFFDEAAGLERPAQGRDRCQFLAPIALWPPMIKVLRRELILGNELSANVGAESDAASYDRVVRLGFPFKQDVRLLPKADSGYTGCTLPNSGLQAVDFVCTCREDGKKQLLRAPAPSQQS